MNTMTSPLSAASDAELPLIDASLLARGADGRLHLRGGECRACGAHSFPRAPVCASCLSQDIADIALPDEGDLYAFSVVHQAPRQWKTPYAVGYVDLAEGTRVFTHLTPIERLRIGQRVRLSTDVVGADPDGNPLVTYVFSPE